MWLVVFLIVLIRLALALSVLRVTHLIATLVSSGYPCDGFWLHIWYLLITPVVYSDYLWPCDVFWLHIWCLPITPVVYSDYLWPCDVFWLHIWYLLTTPVVYSDYFWPCDVFWLHIWSLLITPVVYFDNTLVSSCCACDICWLLPLVSSDYPFHAFWFSLWVLLITPLLSSDHRCDVFWFHIFSSHYTCGIF